MDEYIYKIFRPAEWHAFKAQQVFTGSIHDARDGFIHLCAQQQLSGTIAKHYKEEARIILAQFSEKTIGYLKWETSRNNEKFPHLYGDLHYKDLAGYEDIGRDKNGELNISQFKSAGKK